MDNDIVYTFGKTKAVVTIQFIIIAVKRDLIRKKCVSFKHNIIRITD